MKNLNTMAYLRWNALVITDCANYTTPEARDLINKFRDDYPDNEGLHKRSVNNMVNEWAIHALCYRWGIMRDRSKDADLEFDIEPEVRILYGILGPVARFFLLFYRKKK